MIEVDAGVAGRRELAVGLQSGRMLDTVPGTESASGLPWTPVCTEPKYASRSAPGISAIHPPFGNDAAPWETRFPTPQVGNFSAPAT
jgi:hypothetical protein